VAYNTIQTQNRFDKLKLCTNIIPEEGILQLYLDEGNGAIHDACHVQVQPLA
jgi:hypothetical protein